MIDVRPIAGPDEWREVLALRIAVFVDEQRCPADEEPDPYDADALHLIARDASGTVGCARIVAKGEAAKIGRVAVRIDRRGEGIGKLVVERALREARSAGFREAILDAQTYAIPFYERLGFAAEGPEFDDAGIPHRRMTRPLPTAEEPT